MKQGLLNKISVLGKELPLNTLDELIDKFGGPDKVSEVRSSRRRTANSPMHLKSLNSAGWIHTTFSTQTNVILPICDATCLLQMTGRKGRVVRRPDGSVCYETRAEQGLTIDHINIKEKDRFMGAEKVRSADQIDSLTRHCCFAKTINTTSADKHIQNLFLPVRGHHLGGGQLRDFPAGGQASEEPAAPGPHDLGAALECRQGHPAVR